jgi:hypothetical protein
VGEDDTRGTSTIGRIPRLYPSHTGGAAKVGAQPAALMPDEIRTSSRLHLLGRRFFIDIVIAIREAFDQPLDPA